MRRVLSVLIGLALVLPVAATALVCMPFAWLHVRCLAFLEALDAKSRHA
ncbi:MAG: hypothetical protein WBE92_00045 [Steroidobacteraceae bacterium]